MALFIRLIVCGSIYVYLLSGLAYIWLYAFTYAYNLAWGGLKNGKNGGEPNGFCLVFVVWRIILKKFCDNLKERSTFKLCYISGDFLLLFPPFLFTVHVRPVLSPCQAGNTSCILSCFFKTKSIIK